MVVFYLALAGSQFLATWLAEKPDLRSLQAALTLAPGNAQYRYRLGRLYWSDPRLAGEFYKSAVALNPYDSRYWFDLASAEKMLNHPNQQEYALDRAVRAAPTSLNVALEAANIYWSLGENDKALQEFRVILQNDPAHSSAALQDCWKIRPDTDYLLQNIVPLDAGSLSQFLSLLIANNRRPDAAKVWQEMAAVHFPVEARHIFGYIHYLVDQRDVEQARLVWRQAGDLAGLSAYQPSAENQVVNGDFSLPMLNGGFDWLYEQSPAVSLALDSAQFHSGHRSLAIMFDTGGARHVGIRQLIPAKPNAEYEFSAFFKTGELQGAGAATFVIQDAFSGNPYFVSDDLKDTDFWKPVEGRFSTSADATLLVLQIQCFPPNDAMHGTLWIDGVRLRETQPEKAVR